MAESTETVTMTVPEDMPKPKRRRVLRGVLWTVVSIPVLALAVYFGLDTSIGHRFILDRIEEISPASGLRIRIGRIDGSIYSTSHLKDVRIYDAKGLLFSSPDILFEWKPIHYVHKHLYVAQLTSETATLHKRAEFNDTGENKPLLPGYDITVSKLAINRLIVDAKVSGTRRVGRLLGNAEIFNGRMVANADAVILGTGDRLKLRMDGHPDGDKFAASGTLTMPKGGVFATMAGLDKTSAIAVKGGGKWSDWSGELAMSQPGKHVADLDFTVKNDTYTIHGLVDPSIKLRGRAADFIGRKVRVDGEGRMNDKVLTGRLRAAGGGLNAEANGGIDFANSTFAGFAVDADITKPEMLIPAMRARDMRLSMNFTGKLKTPHFTYRITTPQMTVNNTGFNNVRAQGSGIVPASGPMQLTLDARASEVTGVGTVVGGILQNVRVTGPITVSNTTITGQKLQLTSDQLQTTLAAVIDLTTGKFKILVNGGMPNYYISGLGIIDLQTNLNIVPSSSGKGVEVTGSGVATFRRLDNSFFRSLTGGLPVIKADVRYSANGVLTLTNAYLTSPSLKLAGDATWKPGGTITFKGRGNSAQYGPVLVSIDGNLQRPHVALLFDHPFDAAQLANVKLDLDPTQAGYAYQAAGGSIFGPFTSNGSILLPSNGGNSAIQIDALQAANTVASGTINMVSGGGFDGNLAITGGGIEGTIGLNKEGKVQSIAFDLTADNANFPEGQVRIGSGRAEGVVTLADGGDNNFNGNFQMSAARWGEITIAELAGSGRMANGSGQITLSASGERSQTFNLQSQIGIEPGRYEVALTGSVDQQPVELAQPLIVEPLKDGYRFSNLDLRYAGGTMTGGGLVSSKIFQGNLAMDNLPLRILNVVDPNFGLAGKASGTLTYNGGAGAAEKGDVDLKIWGLSRSALGLQSIPIDIGLNGRLGNGSAGVRAVMATDGHVIGRLQALLSPMESGTASTLVSRLQTAPIQGEVRFNGDAGTFWPLTGVQLFDISGPVALGANVTGTLKNPQIAGSLKATGARLDSAQIGATLTDLNATGRFSGSQLVLDSATAKAGDGTVSATGDFELSQDRGLGFVMNVQTDNALLIDRDNMGASVTGPMAITSDGSGGKITGTLTANKARYRLGAATSGQPVPELDVVEVNRRYQSLEDEKAQAVAAPWTLAITARAKNALYVKGMGLDSEWSGNFAIGGTATAPDILGTATLVRGDYDFAGRTFRLVKGEIVFDGVDGAINPRLDVTAAAHVDDIEAEIHVGGRGLSPQISFTSQPPLPEDELLSRLLFGGSVTDLTPIEAVQLGAALASLRSGGGLDLNPINAIRDAIGLDRLRILPADVTQDRGTSVAAGKYLNGRTYVEIITDGQGYSATRIEYQVTKWLSILATLSTVGQHSINARISKDY